MRGGEIPVEHLSNCHGEWIWIMEILALTPFIGVWLRGLVFKPHKHEVKP